MKVLYGSSTDPDQTAANCLLKKLPHNTTKPTALAMMKVNVTGTICLIYSVNYLWITIHCYP